MESLGVHTQGEPLEPARRDPGLGPSVYGPRPDRHPSRPSEGYPHEPPVEATELAPVADVRQGDQLATHDGHDGRDPQAAADDDGQEAGLVGPKGVEDVGAPSAGLPKDEGPGPPEKRQPPETRPPGSAQGIDDGPVQEVPVPPVGVSEGEDVDLVGTGHRPDQVSDDRDASVGFIATEARCEEGDAHAPNAFGRLCSRYQVPGTDFGVRSSVLGLDKRWRKVASSSSLHDRRPDTEHRR